MCCNVLNMQLVIFSRTAKIWDEFIMQCKGILFKNIFKKDLQNKIILHQTTREFMEIFVLNHYFNLVYTRTQEL